VTSVTLFNGSKNQPSGIKRDAKDSSLPQIKNLPSALDMPTALEVKRYKVMKPIHKDLINSSKNSSIAYRQRGI
jgi:hypothetical protein